MSDGSWIGLFSGGKDSTWAIHDASTSGLAVDRLLTVDPAGDSYLFHRPTISVTDDLAAGMGIPIQHVSLAADERTTQTASDHGDRELAVLQEGIVSLRDQLDTPLAGLVAGAVESQFQYDRLHTLCEELDLSLHAPLWQCSADEALRTMIGSGFDIRITAVAAAGFDESWLGRKLDLDALASLHTLREEYGIHLMGEGGEYETLVVAGPHLTGRLEIEWHTEWDGVRGQLVIESAELTTRL